jgi:signal transduction histidine kinase
MNDLESQLISAKQTMAGAVEIDMHDEVIASLAQELRTPMSSIIGYTDVLLGEQVGILGSLQRKFLQRVKSNTERMGTLLDDLIRITALDKGRLQLEPETVDIMYTTEEVIVSLTDQYREKGLTLRLLLNDLVPPVTADRDAITQVLHHLLANAALASPVKGGVQLTIDSRQGKIPVGEDREIRTQCLYIGVEDSGAGIDPDDFDRVFLRKYRADNPLIEGLGDTGVGLSLTKALIDAHHGRIWLESEKGSGTIFHVLIPHIPPSDGDRQA